MAVIFILLSAVFIASHASVKIKESKQAPVKQTLQDAYITVTAPLFARNETNEQIAGESLKKKIEFLRSYKSEYKKVSYFLAFCRYAKEADMEQGVQSIVNTLKDDNFAYEILDRNSGKLEGKYIEGSFERNGVKYGIKEHLIKKDGLLWQVLAIYPYSEKNGKSAENYINSAEINPDGK